MPFFIANVYGLAFAQREVLVVKAKDAAEAEQVAKLESQIKEDGSVHIEVKQISQEPVQRVFFIE